MACHDANMAPTGGDHSLIGTPAERETLRRLEDFIDEHGYRHGDKLPPERQLAEDLGVSRRVLRTVFSVLEAERKVWRGVGQGTFVGPRTDEGAQDLAQVVKSASPRAAIEARLSLEPIAARYAAQRATSEHLMTLKRAAEETGRAKSFDEFDEWDEHFHRTLVAAADNGVLQAMHDVARAVWDQIAWGHARTRSFTSEWQRVYARQHRVIVEAIENRDLDRAENLMLEHWQTVRGNVVHDPAGKLANY